ncbi:hypothetical protein FGO68_gene1009 [Halteria grandinella]|uniref:Uncharacterized protein n=1 Tax=Halteria grandinella TaxID=5974 RepID=A0A8J8P2P6_HALGN|nr:hypothetical protein FGO68_gene1009 [Halteria grandinella]
MESAHKIVEICPSILVFDNEKLDYIETLSTEKEQGKLSKGVTFYCDEQVTSESFTISFEIMFGEHVTGDSRQRLIKVGSLCEVMIACSNMILVQVKDQEVQRESGLKLGEWNKIDICFQQTLKLVRVGVNGILRNGIEDVRFEDEDLQPYTLGGHSKYTVQKGKDHHHKSRHLFHGLIKKLQM